ncbi:MAG TPA: PspC domain-containing protein [Steroidobacteraceae bacterium]|nr:PspC domain-containing protein [Steroidobacteraceae bacterium]
MTVSEELERLQALRERGALTEAEYAQAKARVLGGAPAGSMGAPGAPGAHNNFLHRLSRSATDRVIGGVCGGLGAHTGLPSWAWRVIFCISVFYFGIGLLFYLLLWIFIPAAAEAPAPPAAASP